MCAVGEIGTSKIGEDEILAWCIHGGFVIPDQGTIPKIGFWPARQNSDPVSTGFNLRTRSNPTAMSFGVESVQ